MKQLLFSLFFAGTCTFGFGGTFTSAVATGEFNNPSTWSFTGDADGIPDPDDDITILSGHTITMASSSTVCSANNVTINAGGQLVYNKALTVYGNYVNNGTESGSNNVYLRGVGKTVSGSGTFSPTIVLNMSPGGSYTILAGTSITKTNPTVVNFGTLSSLTNLGNFTIWKANTATGATGIVFTNGSTGVLELGAHSFMAGHTFNASAPGNTVRIKYSFNLMPAPSGNTYHHLIIISPGVKASQDFSINGNFTINSSGSFDANNFNISLRGNFARNGIFTPTAGRSVNFTGTSNQSISTSAALASTPINFEQININNPATVSLSNGTYRILERLTITQGTFNMNSRPITLVSTSAQTAVIGTCGASANITNASNCSLERFITDRLAGYSDMSSSVVSTTFADWNNEMILVYDYSPPSTYPSAYGYSESAFDYVPVTSASTAIVSGMGYEVYLDSDGNQNNWNAAAINTVGRPTIGAVNISGNITFDNDGWNLVGNPYHANISWDDLHATTTDVSSDIMFYDENVLDFVTVSTGSGELIAPNQGFWINVTGGSPSFTFTEAIKSTSNTSTFRSHPSELFTLRLKSIDGPRFTSGTSFRFTEDPAGTSLGQLPFKGLPHPSAPTLCSYSESNKGLKIKLLNSGQERIDIALKYTVGEDGLYTIHAENLESMLFEGYTCAVLTDRKTGRTVNLTTENYQFYAEKGDDENRFSLRLLKNNGCEGPAAIEVANGQVDINRQNEQTIVKLSFDESTPVQIVVTDLLGRPLANTQNLTAIEQTVSLTLPNDFSGIYLVNVFYGNRVESKKLYK